MTTNNQWKLNVSSSLTSGELNAHALEGWALAHHYIVEMTRPYAGVDCDRFRGRVVARTLSGRTIEVSWNTSLKSGWVTIHITIEKDPAESRWVTEQVIPALKQILGDRMVTETVSPTSQTGE